MDILEKSFYLIKLYDLYQNLLTSKQKDYFESYYFDDYSISEISENYNISRNAVHDQLKRTVNKLYDFEKNLELYHKQKERQKIIDKVKSKTKDRNIISMMSDLEKVE